jgi:hypothetical protein
VFRIQVNFFLSALLHFEYFVQKHYCVVVMGTAVWSKVWQFIPFWRNFWCWDWQKTVIFWGEKLHFFLYFVILNSLWKHRCVVVKRTVMWLEGEEIDPYERNFWWVDHRLLKGWWFEPWQDYFKYLINSKY